MNIAAKLSELIGQFDTGMIDERKLVVDCYVVLNDWVNKQMEEDRGKKKSWPSITS